MYVPEGWYHATHNLDDTVGIVGQNLTHGPITEITKIAMEAARAKSQASAIAAYKRLLELDPENQQAKMTIAGNLIAQQHIKEGVQRSEEHTV